MMDDNLKIMIAGTVKTIANIPPANRTWDAIMSAMLQCPLIEPSKDAVARADKLIKSGVNVFRFNGSPDAAIVKEVCDLRHSLCILSFTSYIDNTHILNLGPGLVREAH